jgi:predicted ATPase
VLPALADLLKDASKRTQIIVTTHSDVLVDAMTDMPKVVLIGEKTEGGTTLTNLDMEIASTRRQCHRRDNAVLRTVKTN